MRGKDYDALSELENLWISFPGATRFAFAQRLPLATICRTFGA